jgi:hypothetical protein
LSREHWKDLVEAVGVLAIVVSLVFVGLEVRQNTNAVKSTVLDSSAQASYDAIVLLIENENLRKAQAAVDGPAPDENRQLMSLYYAALLRIQLNRFMQTRLGVIDEDTVSVVGGIGGIYNNPSFREYWSKRRDNYDPEFISYMEDRVFTD